MALSFCPGLNVTTRRALMMRRIDEPFAGARMLRDFLRLEGVPVGRRHVSTLMGKMGIEALYRHPNTSRKHPDGYPPKLGSVKIN